MIFFYQHLCLFLNNIFFHYLNLYKYLIYYLFADNLIFKMIIKSFEHQKLIKNNCKIFLIYGENDGYKNQVINDVFINNFKGDIERFEENEIINNYENFSLSLRNKSFFSKLKLILITRVSEKILKLINELLYKEIEDVKIILNAQTLEKKSKLRSIFEKEKNLICVPFYRDNNSTLSQIANNFFKKNKISISQEVINLIVERSSGDRINLNNELNKISEEIIIYLQTI